MTFTLPDRLRALPPYLFVDIDRKKQALLAAGKDVINFGIGDPDLPTHAFIIDRMERALRNTAYHRYPHDRGLPEFRQAIARFFQGRYGVTLDAETEVLVVIGTKEGIGHLPLAVLNPGQAALIPTPGYPVYNSGTVFAGGVPKFVTLTETNGWLPDFGHISNEDAAAARLMFLNYPNNPTGAIAPREFFERAVAFAANHDILIAHDAAYNEMHLRDFRPPSILEFDGAKNVAVEFHSLSKTFNMTGWRLGFVAGNPEVVAALARIKSNLDSGQFMAIQEAGIAAFEGIERPEFDEMRETYNERAITLCAGLKELGFAVEPPQATFYVWAGVPAGYDTMRTVNKLLDEAAVVCIPGTGFGPAGEGYVRFALTVDAQRTAAALDRMRKLRW